MVGGVVDFKWWYGRESGGGDVCRCIILLCAALAVGRPLIVGVGQLVVPHIGVAAECAGWRGGCDDFGVDRGRDGDGRGERWEGEFVVHDLS